jgi:hypothetical protein
VLVVVICVVTLKTEMVRSFEMLVTTYKTTRHHNPEVTIDIFAAVKISNLV